MEVIVLVIVGVLIVLLVRSHFKFEKLKEELRVVEHKVIPAELEAEKYRRYCEQLDRSSSIERMRLRAIEAQYHAHMLDGGYEELRTTRADLAQLKNQYHDTAQRLNTAEALCIELRTLATVAAATGGRNVSPELASAVALTVAGRMGLSEFATTMDLERTKALTSGDGKRQLEAGDAMKVEMVTY